MTVWRCVKAHADEERSTESGAALVEMAMVTPLLLLMALGVGDFGRVMYSAITLSHAARDRPRPMSLAPGSTLGPYAIRAELGHGGMGVVYTAHDPRLDRQVAIKVLTPDLTRDDTAKQRFLQEAQAASALDHPNICTIHEINETDDGQL